ncbi:1065_t:CDS:2 [Diversispora eburnea]|uniref:1065_t:CDS:1 n=1 Tax=Diversispora eburnea TaxID=1213867 RepID=A0A9N8Z9F7_9GLOM|nr:1065_t:CDS:2 [Diversispora eburnea]
MTTKIPTEILIKIFNNVQSLRSEDLYSFLLVNRNWCNITIPLLWKLPLDQECCTDDEKLRKKALCIRTYISSIFDYPSFIHKFRTDNLVHFISIYSQQIIGSNNNKNESRILFREICKLIINRCSYLEYFKLAKVARNFSANFDDYGDSIVSILKLPGALKVFKKLKTFISVANDDQFRPLYELLVLICHNLLNMDLEINSYSSYQEQLLTKLISGQKRLENLSIIDNSYTDCHLLFWAIISQKETLKSLRLKKLYYYRCMEKSPPIMQFTSLQELYIEDCYGLNNSDCLSLASSFTQLSSFHYFDSNWCPQEFIIKIFETANSNLRNIYLELYPEITFDSFSAILNYCTKITKLTLPNLRPEQVIAIFNNNFNELRRFSFGIEKGLDANKLLCQMAKNVPESLETIEIQTKMNYDPWIISASSLRNLFEGWCYKGEGNKKIIVKRTRLRQFKLSDEHFKVIEKYGVQLDIIDMEK